MPFLVVGDLYTIKSCDAIKVEDGMYDFVYGVQNAMGVTEYCVDFFEALETPVQTVAPTKDAVRPEHYNQGGMQLIDFIDGSFTKEEYRGFMKGTIQRYITRFDKKNGVEDLKKAQQYLTWLIEYESRC